MIEGLRSRVQGLVFRYWGLGFRVEGLPHSDTLLGPEQAGPPVGSLDHELGLPLFPPSSLTPSSCCHRPSSALSVGNPPRVARQIGPSEDRRPSSPPQSLGEA